MLDRTPHREPRRHRRVEIVFGPGLTAVTGETGAGKTMLVEAIELLVGGRADARWFATGLPSPDRRTSRHRRGRRDRATRSCRRRAVAGVPQRPFATWRRWPRQRGHRRPARPARPSVVAVTATQRAALDEYGRIDLRPLRRRGPADEIDAGPGGTGGDERAAAREDPPPAVPGRGADRVRTSSTRTKTRPSTRRNPCLPIAAAHPRSRRVT